MAQSAILTEPAINLNGDLKELERLAGWLGQCCREAALEGDIEFRLNLALEELFTNSVRHGGCKGMKDAASIRLQADGPDVLVEYSDREQPFDPADAPPPDLDSPLAERRSGGLGLHFIRQMTHHFEYHRVGERNQITMRLSI
jgi:serine/threonine-protein kinase RsbW